MAGVVAIANPVGFAVLEQGLAADRDGLVLGLVRAIGRGVGAGCLHAVASGDAATGRQRPLVPNGRHRQRDATGPSVASSALRVIMPQGAGRLQGDGQGEGAISGLTPSLAEANPEILALTRRYVTLHKDFIRPWQRQARLYHHTPVIPGVGASGWCVLENVAADRSRAVAGIFRLVNAREETFHLRLRGLDPARRYRVTTEPGGLVFEMDGTDLQERGMHIRLDTPLTFRLLLCDGIGRSVGRADGLGHQ